MVPSKRDRSGNHTGSDRFLFSSAARAAGFVFASAATVRLTALLAALSCIWLQPAAAQMPQAPEIAVSGNGVDITNGATRPSATDHTNFGDAALLDESGENAVVERIFTISNGGTGTLTLGANAVSLKYRLGARRGGWRVKTQPAETVAAGGTTTFTIAFDPSSATTQSVSISIASDDADENPFRFRVGGRGVTARMGLTWAGENLLPTGTVDFGELEVAGAATQQVVTVANTGRYALALGEDAVTIEGDADFTVVTQPAATVAPGETTTFTLAFAAAVPGERTATATLAVANDLLRRPGVEISLEGEGAAPAVTVEADAPSVTEGTAASFILTRTRSTTEPLTVGVTVSETGDMLAAPGEGQRSVTFAAGSATATLTVATVADTADEADSVVTVTVVADTADPITYKPGTPAAASVTVDDIKLPAITVAADAASVTEGTAAAFILTRTRSMTEALTVGVTVSESGDVLAATEEGQKSVTFAAGSATATLSVATQADSADEDDSRVTVTVGADSANPPTYKPGSPAAASVTVNDDDVNRFTIAFERASYSVAENTGHFRPLRVTIVFRSSSGRRPAGAVSVNVATRAGSAQAEQDFTTTTETISVPRSRFSGSGRATHRISVDILNDGDYEGPETFDLVLSSPGATDSSDSASLGTTATATATITDDDRPAITVTADTASVTEGSNAVFTLRRAGIVTGPLTVGVTVSEDGDVLAATEEGQKSVTFQAGARTAMLSVATQADSADEDDSTVTVTVAADSMSPATYVRGSPAAASATVIDDDVNRFTIAFAEESYSVAESGPNVQLQVQVAFASSSNRPPAGDLSVTVKTRGASAQAGQDFRAQSSVLTVRPGVHFDASGRATATLFIPISDDSASEPAETFLVDLSLPEATDSSDSASLGTPATTTVTITDNEPPGITVAADAASVTEGTAAVFTLTRTRIVTDTLTVAVTVSEDGDVLAAADEGQKSVTFAAGALTAELSLPTVDDAADEADSTVTLTVNADTANPATYVPGTPATASVTVNDDEVPAVTVAAGSASVTEGTAAEFILTRTGILTEQLTVGVTVSEDGDVLAAADEGRKSVIFQANEAMATLSVDTQGDAADEADSVVTVTVNADIADPATYAPGTPAAATVTVNDDDVPAITITAGTSPVTEGTAAAFTLTRAGIVTAELTVGVTVSEDGDVLAATDEGQKSVTFQAGARTATLSVTTQDDSVSEAHSAVTVTVNADTTSPATYVPGTPAAATVTVNNDDVNAFTIAFAQTPYSVDEDAGPLTIGIVFQSAIGQPPVGPLSVFLRTLGVTARAVADYGVQQMSVGVQPGDFDADGRATLEVSIPIVNDSIYEGAETFLLDLTSPVATHSSDSASEATPSQVTVTIADDDLPAVTVAADAPSVTEGTAAAFTLTRAGIVTAELTVGVTVSETGDVLAAADEGQKSVTFAANSATATLSLTTEDDAVDEADSVVTVTVNPDTASPATYEPGTTATATVTVNDNEVPAITVEADAASVTEGIAAAFTLTRTGATDEALEVGVTVMETGGMLSGTGPDSVTFGIGSLTATLSLATENDAATEANSVVTVTVDADTANPITYAPGTPATATVTVIDNDIPAITVVADAASVTEGTAAAFTLTRTGLLTAPLTVGVTVSEDGDVLAAADEGQKSVMFTANSATATLSVTTQNDLVSEAHSAVTVTVNADSADPINYMPGTPAAATVTVNNDDVNAFTIAFAQPSYSVAEDAGPLTIGIEFESAIGQAPVGPVSVFLQTRGVGTAGFTAQSLADYGTQFRSVGVQPGDFDTNGRATLEVNIPIVNDSIYEGAETFRLDLSFPVATHSSDSASVGTPSQAIVTIADDDLPVITVAADAASVTEGTAASFTLTRTRSPAAALTVGVTVSEDGDVLAAADEGQKSVTFAAGMATATLSLPTDDDAALEAASVVTVTVNPDTADPANYEVGTTATATVTVNDNDLPAITVAADAASVTEGTAAAFTLTRTGNLTAPLTVGVTVSEDGEVLAAADEGQKSVMFTANSATATLSVTTQNDAADEADSVVTVTVNPDTVDPIAYAPGTTATATVTVSDNDLPAVTVAADAASVTEGTAASFTLTRVGILTDPLTVGVTVTQTGDMLSAAGPASVTFAANSATVALSLATEDDAADEVDSVVTVTVNADTADPATYEPGTTATATVTVNDNDVPGVPSVPAISIAAGTSPVTEGTAAEFTLTRTGSMTAPLTVGVTVSETGDVLAAADEGQKSVMFTANSATATLSVTTQNDAVDEADSVVTVTVNPDTTNPITYAPGTTATATVTVNDNDLPAVTVAAGTSPVTEGTAAAFTLTRMGATDAALEVGVTVSESRGNSEFENDGVLAPSEQGARTVTFAIGSSTTALSVATHGDTADEADSVVTVTVVADTTSPATYEPGTPAAASVTVTDDDGPLELTWSVLPETQFVDEGATAQVTIRLAADKRPTEHVSFRIFQAEQDTVSAEAGLDFEVIAPRLIEVDASAFTAAMGGGYVHEFVHEVDIVDDEIAELGESFTITLGLVTAFNEGHAVIGTEGTITIRTSDQPVPVISIAAGTSPVTEGTAAAFTLTRTGSTTAPLTVGVTVSETGDVLATADKGEKSVMFAAGVATAMLSVATQGDAADEADSVVTVTVEADTADPITYAPGTPPTASVTVNDDDGAPSVPAVTIAAGTSPVTEGTAASFTLTRTGSMTGTLTVGVTVTETGGDMLAAADEGEKSVMFADGAATATLSVTTQNDAADEADSVVTVTVNADTADPINYEPGTTATATVTVSDNDLPAITIAAGTSPVTEGTAAAFTLTRTGLLTAALTVGVTVSEDGDVLAAADEGQKSVTFAANSATAELSVTTQNDTVSEAHSAVTVTVNADTTSPATYELGTPVAATVTVDNDDVNHFNIQFSQSSYSVDEDAGPLTIGIRFESAVGQPPVGPVSVFLSTLGYSLTSGFTAVSDNDYTSQFMSVGVQPGDFDASGRATLEVSIPINDDSNYEGAETFRLDLSSPEATHSSDGARLGTDIQVTVTIADDDLPAITVTADAASVTEGIAAEFTLRRTGIVTEVLAVEVSVSEDGDMLSGTPDSSVTFEIGSATAALSVATVDDAADEADSVVTVTVDADTTNPAAYEVGTPATATVTVNDNDLPAITVEADTASVTEGTAAAFTLTRAGILTAALTVGVTVSEDGDMLSGTPPTSVTFEANSATAELSLATVDDAASEADSVVTVTVNADTASTATYVPGTPAAATVTVNDNEVPAITVEADAASVTEGTAAAFTLRRTGATDEALEVGVSVSEDGDMLSGTAPTSVTFAANSATVALSLPTEADTADEADSVVTVSVDADTTNPATYALGTPATATVTVNDDDVPAITVMADLAFVPEDSIVAEGELAAFILTRTGLLTAPLTVGVTVSETGDVLAAADEGQKSVMFVAGAATATLSLATDDDMADEADSVVTVTVNADTADPANYEPGTTATASVTVTDDDLPAITVAADAASVTEGTAAAFTLTRAGILTEALTVGVTVSESRGNSEFENDGVLAPSEQGARTVTFAAGSPTAALSVATEDDTADEAESEVTVTVVAPGIGDPITYAPGTPAAASVTVSDDDGPLELTWSVIPETPFVDEGATAHVTIRLAVDKRPTEHVSFRIFQVAGTAEAGSDFEVIAPRLIEVDASDFTAVSGGAGFFHEFVYEVDIVDDEIAEVGESFTIKLGLVTAFNEGHAVVGTEGTITIPTNDQPVPVVSIAAGTSPVTEGMAAEFTLTRTGATDEALEIGVIVSEDGDMLHGGQSGFIFEAGSATATLSLATVDDAVDETDSVVTVTVNTDIANPITYAPGTPATASVTVNDNDVPAITIAADTTSETEGTAAAFTLTRTGLLTEELTVVVTVEEDGDMLSGTAPASVTFAANSATAPLSLPTADDAADEADSVVTVTVNADTASPATYELGTPATATVTVNDNDLPEITVAADAASVTEGMAASFTLTRAGIVTAALTVGVTVSEDGDMLSGTAPTSVTFAANSATAALSLATEDDAAEEAHSVVTVTVNADTASTATYVLGTSAAATVTVNDNEVLSITIAADAASVTEGTAASFTLTRTRIVTDTLTVAVTVSEDGDVLAAADEGQKSVTFAAGSLTAALSLATVDDAADEADSVVTITVNADTADPANYLLGTPAAATATVNDNDLPAITVAADAASVTEGTAASFTLTRTGLLTAALTAGVTVSEDGDVLAAADEGQKSVTFGAGSATATLSLATEDDAATEAASVVTVTVDADSADPATYEPGTPAAATVTVNDDDDAPSVPAISIAAGTSPVTEGTAASFTLSRSGIVTAALTVGVTVSEDGDMLSGTAPTSVTFQAGSATATLSLPTEDDATNEADSVVTVTVVADSADPITYAPGTPATATVTVDDNDLPAITVAADAASVTEGTAAAFTLTRTGVVTEALTVGVTVSEDGDMLAEAAPTSVTFAGSSATATLSLATEDDTADEENSAVTVTVVADSADPITYAPGTPAAATVTVTDNDVPDIGMAQRISGAREWLVRFGRTVTALVSETLGSRMSEQGPKGDRLTIAGRAVPIPASDGSATPAIAAAFDDASRDRADDHGSAGEVPLDTLLSASGFAFSQGSENGSGWSIWGQGSGGRFSGEEGSLSLSGEVVSATAGLEYAGLDSLGGIAVIHGRGGGGYEHRLLRRPASKHEIVAHLTGVHPYVRISPDERTRFWGTFGFSQGSMSVKDPRGSYDSDIEMLMGAVGASRQLLRDGGFDLKLRGDAFGTHIGSQSAPGLLAVEGDVFRLRAGAEAGHELAVGNGTTLRPSLEAGLRYDGGDVETGAGLELGGGLEFRDPARGVSVEAGGRLLVMHSDSDYRDWSVSGSFRLDPEADGRGLFLSLQPSYDTGGAERGGQLMLEQGFAGLENDRKPSGKVRFEMGYGLGAFGTGVLTPHAGVEVDDAGTRRYGTGVRLRLGGNLSLGVTSRHRFEGGNDHVLQLRGSARW